MSEPKMMESMNQDNSDHVLDNIDDGKGESDTEPNDFDGMKIATRGTSKGRKVRKGQRSSASDVTEDVHNRKSNRVQENIKGSGTMAALPGIDKCFVGARVGAKGLRGALARNKLSASLTVSDLEIDYVEKHLLQFDPIRNLGPKLIQNYLDKNGLNWLSQMTDDFNILLYGFGNKKPLVLQFVKEYLNGSKVLSIDGSVKSPASSNKAIKALLDAICSKILHQEHLWSTCLELNSYVNLVCENLNKFYGRESQDFRNQNFSVPQQKSSSSVAPLYDTSYMRIQQLEHENGEEYDDDDDDDDENIITKENAFEDGTSGGPLKEEVHAVGRKRSTIITGSRSMSNSSSAPTGPADPAWGGRYSHIQERLYIVAFDLDGECMQSSESQSCMSLLAACSSVSMIANVEKLNAALLWSSQTACNYKWLYNHVPTYQSYPFHATETNTLSGSSKDFPGGAKAVAHIMRCLTERHNNLINLLVIDALKHYDADSGNMTSVDESIEKYHGISIDELLEITTSNLVARTMEELNKLLTELIAHKIVSKFHDSLRKIIVSITLPVNVLRAIVRT